MQIFFKDRVSPWLATWSTAQPSPVTNVAVILPTTATLPGKGLADVVGHRPGIAGSQYQPIPRCRTGRAQGLTTIIWLCNISTG